MHAGTTDRNTIIAITLFLRRLRRIFKSSAGLSLSGWTAMIGLSIIDFQGVDGVGFGFDIIINSPPVKNLP
jgi:hypothetical protein